ncbi:MAG: 2-C-methyl-D-erythritol 2,4-cyclodiphosphate synthase [Candidatus Izemoplasmataceae bacterium]
MIRIGHSTDIHQLKKGETLILGGLKIPSPYESVGHSDADCLLHAIAESLLGAIALGDLGTHFPDTLEDNKNLDSKVILKFAYEKVLEKGFKINNIDSMIFLQTPKLKDYIEPIKTSIAQLLDLDSTQVSVKATTGEKRGIIGNSEVIVCESVVLIENNKR